jgi:protein-tyrosine phosphatase
VKSIIFVCLGNICRSSLAEGVAIAKAKSLGLELQVDSAGTSRYHNGEPPCTISQELARSNGIDISKQRSEHISDFDLHSYDMVIAMDESNFRDLRELGLENLYKFGNFGFNGADVADLYYAPDKAQSVYKMIDMGVESILKNFMEPS